MVTRHVPIQARVACVGSLSARHYADRVSLSSWSALLAACLLISFTPGAGAIYTMSNAINVGHRRTIWGVLGLQAALIIQLAIVAAGLGVVVAGSPTAFAVIRYLGAAYLVYLASGRSCGHRSPPPTPSWATHRSRRARCSSAVSG